MNATAKALAAGTLTGYNVRHMLLSFQSIILGLLLCASLVTACGIIYLKDMSRQEVMQLHSLRSLHQQMIVDQGKLLLEQNTWSSPIRIQNIATTQLNMVMPAKNAIVFA